MRGVKRAAVSESNDPSFKNAKPMEGTLFGIQKNVAPMQKSSLTSASLDKQRAELARKNVRALNNQFVSWVQLQLKNHPDELWEDGMNDYISHASNILEKFKDVVNWLKENKGKGENVSPESRAADKKTVADAKSSDVKSVSNNSLFASNSQPGLFSNKPSSNFSSSQSSLSSSQPGAFSSSQFGSTFNSQTGSFGSSQFGVAKSSQPSLLSSSQAGAVSNSQTGSFSSGQFGSAKSSQPSLLSSSQAGAVSNSQTGFFTSGQFGSAKSSQPSLLSSSQAGAVSNSQTGSFNSGQFGSAKSSQPSLFSSSQAGAVSNSQTGSFNSGQFGSAKSSQPSLFSSSQAGAVSTSQPPFSSSNNQNPFSSGAAPVPIAVKRDSADDADGDEQPQPSSPSVKKTKEEGVTVVHEVKCKLYVKSSDPADKGWKDRGTGNLSIKCKEGVDKGTKESKPTILVRNDVGKLLLNALLYAGIKTSPQKNALVAIFHSSEDSSENVTPRTFLIRTKTAEARDKLATAIHEYAPSS
ncbi:PREDICTED: nuclear pore complex protein NUP98B-like isoform X3 [Camelina sativa]|uniref:Nuclear pore complex protein NUP98B-like isoform X3 n=1 Tax=Camelina sativa TaxID=90675 RepID=A0ABM0U0Q8_CAMSA|nr:PREDICTED: nuclear pore complex protein NUP98B-like isoform X3 [Camelina sativa]